MQRKQDNPDCLFVRVNLFAKEEQTLAERENRRFDEHVSRCQKCAGIAADFRSVLGGIEQKKSEVPDPFMLTRLNQRILSEVESSLKKRDSLFTARFQFIPFMLFILVAAFIGILLAKQSIAGFSSGRNHQVLIESMKSSLRIADFVEEENTMSDNR